MGTGRANNKVWRHNNNSHPKTEADDHLQSILLPLLACFLRLLFRNTPNWNTVFVSHVLVCFVPCVLHQYVVRVCFVPCVLHQCVVRTCVFCSLRSAPVCGTCVFCSLSSAPVCGTCVFGSLRSAPVCSTCEERRKVPGDVCTCLFLASLVVCLAVLTCLSSSWRTKAWLS